jgi:archaellum component FlaC
MKEDMAEMRRNAEAEIEKLSGEVVKKEALMEKMKSSSDNVKEENSTLRTELKAMEQQFAAKEEEWLQAQDDLLFEVNNVKRKWTDSETRLNECRYECQKLDEKYKVGQQSINELK